MDEYLFITLAKLRFDARRLQARNAELGSADRFAEDVRPQYLLDEAAVESRHRSPRARWYVPGSGYGEQS
ncbi:MAG TPA: hypothetical protein VGN07_11145 [Steroidobacteraceae bacterium]